MTSLPNPLISGFNPDPSIIRVGHDYYLTTSTFEYLPGLPIYHSTDLVTWAQVGNVVVRDAQLELGCAATNLGLWAPTLRFRDGLFYVIVTDTAQRGTCLFTATDPTGPWNDGVDIGIDGIDPDLAWDSAGNAYVTYSAVSMQDSDIGSHRGIEQVRIDTTSGAILNEPRSLWSGTGGMFPEAPHLYHVGEYWYLMIAEGGTERGHAISSARATCPEGPFEPCPSNPLVTARSTARPVQCTGHGDLFQGPQGQWHVVMLGTRPRGTAESFSPLGRETFISPANWTEDGWFEIDPVEPNPRAPYNWFQQFDREPGDEWIGVRRRPDEFAQMRIRPGWLILIGEGEGMSAQRPVFIGHRQEHQTSTIRAVIDASEGTGGLAVRYDEEHHYEVEVTPGRITARAVIPGFVHEVAGEVANEGATEVVLESRVPQPDERGHESCDVISLGHVLPDGEVSVLAEVDGRYLSNESAASFTGRVFGLYAVDGAVAFKSITYSGDNS